MGNQTGIRRVDKTVCTKNGISHLFSLIKDVANVAANSTVMIIPITVMYSVPNIKGSKDVAVAIPDIIVMVLFNLLLSLNQLTQIKTIRIQVSIAVNNGPKLA